MLVGNNNNNIPDDDDYDSNIGKGDYEEQINTVNVDNLDDDIEVQEEASALASTPGKNILLLGVVLIGSLYLVYNLVFKQTDEEIKAKKIQEDIKSQPVKNAVRPTQDSDGIQLNVGVAQAPELPNFEDEISLVDDSKMNMPKGDGFSDEDSDKNIFEQWPTFNQNQTNDQEFDPEGWKEITVQTERPTGVGGILPPTMEVKASVPAVPVVAPATTSITSRVARTPVQVNVGGPTPEEIAAKESAKRRQPMLMVGGGGGGAGNASTRQKELDELLNGDFEMQLTSADKSKAALIGNTDNMIAQGKMIDAVLETAINTDLDGVIRAIISRDTYAESGRNILIPKGSRLIGNYTVPDEGAGRVVIEWTRVIRPDGIDIMIDSPGTDKMGRAGIPGFVDYKYFDIITNALLLSTLSIGTSLLVDDINESQQQTSTSTTNTDGSTTTSNTGTTTDAAVLSSVSDISDIADSIAEGLLNDKPTVIVQQGTRIKVFVNRDLHFPNSAANNITFVQ
ncbi:MAG: hypothetical protein COV35_04330 [Alphaproteobacteria bacterium CG11_big_fil_rev_8_21_14_0_20_39_49]|nr:MAG: hypothetical protein COV35_04330 [Alphaproteobacteria bacterium CG11_big_fil_rev_8_21_14_0_20_39_49]